MSAVLQNYLVVQTQCHPPFDQLGHEQHVSPCLALPMHSHWSSHLVTLLSVFHTVLMLNMLSHAFGQYQICYLYQGVKKEKMYKLLHPL